MALKYPPEWDSWNEEQKRIWIANRIAEAEKYLGKLKEESRRLVLSKNIIFNGPGHNGNTSDGDGAGE
jgi:hypothetical protein